MNVGDRVLVNESETLFHGCEGYIIEINEHGYLVSLYKPNHKVAQQEIGECDVYFNENALELLPKLNIKELRKNKNTKIISTEESLEDVIPFFDENYFE